MSDYVEQTSEALEDVRRMVRCIDRMAVAFGETGNVRTSDMLFEIGLDLSIAERKINKAIGEEIHERYKESQQGLGNILIAALASAAVVKEDES